MGLLHTIWASTLVHVGASHNMSINISQRVASHNMSINICPRGCFTQYEHQHESMGVLHTIWALALVHWGVSHNMSINISPWWCFTHLDLLPSAWWCFTRGTYTGSSLLVHWCMFLSYSLCSTKQPFHLSFDFSKYFFPSHTKIRFIWHILGLCDLEFIMYRIEWRDAGVSYRWRNSSL